MFMTSFSKVHFPSTLLLTFHGPISCLWSFSASPDSQHSVFSWWMMIFAGQMGRKFLNSLLLTQWEMITLTLTEIFIKPNEKASVQWEENFRVFRCPINLILTLRTLCVGWTPGLCCVYTVQQYSENQSLLSGFLVSMPSLSPCILFLSSLKLVTRAMKYLQLQQCKQEQWSSN